MDNDFMDLAGLMIRVIPAVLIPALRLFPALLLCCLFWPVAIFKLRQLPTVQSLNGSNSPSPAIATANGRSVCSTLTVPA